MTVSGEVRGALRIRRAESCEAGTLTDLVLRSKAMWGYDDNFMALCRRELTVQPSAIENGEVWVAEAGGVVVGVVELVAEGREIDVRLIFVEPRCTGSGIGSALWAHAEARSRGLGAETLCLDADPNAVGFYERMGMCVVGTSPSGSIPGRRLPHMVKRLAHPPSRAVWARRRIDE